MKRAGRSVANFGAAWITRNSLENLRSFEEKEAHELAAVCLHASRDMANLGKEIERAQKGNDETKENNQTIK